MVQLHVSFQAIASSAALLMLCLTGSAQAQNKITTAEMCVEAIATGDMEKAEQLASEIKNWRALFAPNTISKAEQCLQAAFGENWTYFATKGRFLSGDEARAEQEFIDGADARRVAQELEEKRLACAVIVSAHEVKVLEAERDKFERVRAVEALWKTIDACKQVYQADPSAALLEPVCNDVFLKVGIPDTEYAFDFNELEAARLRLGLAELQLIQKRIASNTENGAEVTELEVCRELLAE